MKRILLASLLILTGAVHASADDYYFKDVQRPHGHSRSHAVKMADFRACGAVNAKVAPARLSAAVQCLNARGWAVARIDRDSAPATAPTDSGPGFAFSIGGGGDSSVSDDAQKAGMDDMNAGTQDMQNVVDVNSAALRMGQ